ncbi:MAG: immunoglobulin domain-containing protein [Holophagaceae bacterium]|nr:immunoglobulin domain-containing protein [Holophagaceae bacterium]
MKIKHAIIAFFTTTLAFFVSCSGGGGGGGGRDNPPSATIAVTIAPKSIDINSGETQQFTATVTGTNDQRVTWSLVENGTGATLSQNGLYTAPTVSGTYHIKVVSVANASKSDTATVNVTVPRGLNYTDPTSGYGFRFVKNTALTTKTHLVLDLVATQQSSQCAGFAITVSHDSANAVSWAKVSPTDKSMVQNGAVFSIGAEQTGLMATTSGTQIKAIVSQKGVGDLKNLNNGVLASIALDIKDGATPCTIPLTVEKFEIINGNRTITSISTGSVRFGTLTIN